MALRAELRAFLDTRLPPVLADVRSPEDLEDLHFSPQFSHSLGKFGWIGVGWPKERGGRGLGPVEVAICWEELISRRAPVGYHFAAERQIGPSLMVHGSQEQKAFFLPRIVRGEMSICIGYTEPDAGSDLAALRTTARGDGDGYVISGQKVYTSGAHRAEYIWLAARTNPAVSKHQGLSIFLLPLATPGTTVRPFLSLVGHRMNEVFFDKVHVTHTALVGEEDRGWQVMVGDLDFERSGIDRLSEYRPLFDAIVGFARQDQRGKAAVARNPALRARLAELAIEFQVGRLLCYRAAWSQSQGLRAGWQGSMSKLYASEWGQRVAATGMSLLGRHGQTRGKGPWTPLDGAVSYAYLRTLSHTIRAGTSEIQRSIIAVRGLALPR